MRSRWPGRYRTPKQVGWRPAAGCLHNRPRALPMQEGRTGIHRETGGSSAMHLSGATPTSCSGQPLTTESVNRDALNCGCVAAWLRN